MTIDFRRQDLPQDQVFDLCIVGGGAAGITLAREFIGTPYSVCLLESGGFDYEEETQELNQGKNVGVELWDMEYARLRYFGGTTNHWGGWCAPMTEIDFRKRDWVPNSGWPITLADLDPFYERAKPICDLGPAGFDESLWQDLPVEKTAFDPGKLATRFWQYADDRRNPEENRAFTPTRFGKKYRQDITSAPNVTLLLNANVTNLQANESGSRVDYADVRALSGRSGRVHARHFVLACGGMENARVLLNSDGVEPAGLGNRHDQVGRHFMDHPRATCGKLVAEDALRLAEVFGRWQVAGSKVLAGLYSPPALQEAKRVLSGCVVLKWLPEPDNGVSAVQDAWLHLKSGKPGQIELDDLLNIGRDLDEVTAQMLRKLRGKNIIPPLEGFELFLRGEQAPDPQSRITLTADRDALGMRRMKVELKMGDLDKESARVLLKAIAEEAGRLQIGRVQLHDWLLEPGNDWSGAPDLHGGHHFMGSTRMSDDPKTGVVDRDCRVHGLANLHIASSSVFATGGYANPTLTIVAMTLRLGDHLKQAVLTV